jgi:pimeloyl-ACP methyl ester carboxylesterase
VTSYGPTSGDLFVFGHSEGAVMAAPLAGHDPHITDVVFIGGSGTTQLFDFIAGAYRKCFDVSVCIAEIDRQLQAINANPSSSTHALRPAHRRTGHLVRGCASP